MNVLAKDMARYKEFARKGGHNWEAPASEVQTRNESRAMKSTLFPSTLEPWEGNRLEQRRLGTRSMGKDAGYEELFGNPRRPTTRQDVWAGRSVTDVMPVLDMSPLGMLDANKTMAGRAAAMIIKAGPGDDGTFAGLLRSPRPTNPRHVSDSSIAPYNDGSVLSDTRAVAAAILNGRRSTTAARMVPGRAAPVTEDVDVVRYDPPPRKPHSDIYPQSALAAHPYNAEAPKWDTTAHRRHPTDLMAAPKPGCFPSSDGRGEPSRNPHPQRYEYRHRVTDLRSEGRNIHAADRQSGHDYSYMPPPRPLPEMSAPLPPPMNPNHHSDAPWPQDVRRPILCSDVTSHSDMSNEQRNGARARRQREADGLAPAVPLQLYERQGRPRAHVEFEGTDFSRGGPGGRARRSNSSYLDLGSDFSREFSSDLSRSHMVDNRVMAGRFVHSDIHGPTSMRHPKWGGTSHGGRYHGSLSAEAAADSTRAGEEQLQRASEVLKAKIYDKFKSALNAFRTIDTDHSGLLSYDEIVTTVQRATPPQSPAACAPRLSPELPPTALSSPATSFLSARCATSTCRCPTCTCASCVRRPTPTATATSITTSSRAWWST